MVWVLTAFAQCVLAVIPLVEAMQVHDLIVGPLMVALCLCLLGTWGHWLELSPGSLSQPSTPASGVRGGSAGSCLLLRLV